MDTGDLIPAHLIHEGHEGTLRAFERSEHSLRELTKRCLELANDKRWLDVIELLENLLPDVLKKDTELLFDLLTMEYVRMISSNDRMEALKFAKDNFTPFRELKTHEKLIEDRMVLLGCDQNSSPPYLLTVECQDQVVNKLEVTIQHTLASLGPLASLHISDEELVEVSTRRRILDFPSNSRSMEAINLIEQEYPGLLEGNTILRVEILALRYLEYLRAGNNDAALEFAGIHFVPYLEDPNHSNHKNHILECMGILALVDLPQTPVLLTNEHRKHVVYKLNRAIRAHGQHPSSSGLEKLIQCVLKVEWQLDKNDGQDVVLPSSSLKDILKD